MDLLLMQHDAGQLLDDGTTTPDLSASGSGAEDPGWVDTGAEWLPSDILPDFSGDTSSDGGMQDPSTGGSDQWGASDPTVSDGGPLPPSPTVFFPDQPPDGWPPGEPWPPGSDVPWPGTAPGDIITPDQQTPAPSPAPITPTGGAGTSAADGTVTAPFWTTGKIVVAATLGAAGLGLVVYLATKKPKRRSRRAA